MIPGPDQVIACPCCNGLAKYPTLVSGNTFGAEFWTDGKVICPMLPTPPVIVRCIHCAECYWLDDAEKVGTCQPYELIDPDLRSRLADQMGMSPADKNRFERQIDPSWTATEDVEEPTEEEYYAAIDNGLARDPTQQRVLRILAWWQRNNAYRGVGCEQIIDVIVTDACRQNLETLASLLDLQEENDRLVKAEILRELHRFEAATSLLSDISSNEKANEVGQLRSFCVSRDACVRRFNSRIPRRFLG
jgi:hypothetical protein